MRKTQDGFSVARGDIHDIIDGGELIGTVQEYLNRSSGQPASFTPIAVRTDGTKAQLSSTQTLGGASDAIRYYRDDSGSPPPDDDAGWERTANRVMQLAMLAADVAEGAAWENAQRTLIAERLDYAEFITRRTEMLRGRLPARKLTQANLRYKLGYRNRPAHLVRHEIRDYLKQLHGERAPVA